MTTTNSSTSHFPVKAGNGVKVHWYTEHTYTDGNNETRTHGATACNITSTVKTWFRRGGTQQPRFQTFPEGTPVTCERCLAAYEAYLAEQAPAAPAEEPTWNYVNLFNLPETTATRKEFRKLVRKVTVEQGADYTIEDHCYIVTLPSQFVYKFLRTDDGTTYVWRVSRPD